MFKDILQQTDVLSSLKSGQSGAPLQTLSIEIQCGIVTHLNLSDGQGGYSEIY